MELPQIHRRKLLPSEVTHQLAKGMRFQHNLLSPTDANTKLLQLDSLVHLAHWRGYN